MVSLKGFGNTGFILIWSSYLESFLILVKPISMESFCLQVLNSYFVFSLVKRVQEKMHIPQEWLWLIHEEWQLQDQNILSEYDITKDIVIYMVTRIWGGFLLLYGGCPWYSNVDFLLCSGCSKLLITNMNTVVDLFCSTLDWNVSFGCS